MELTAQGFTRTVSITLATKMQSQIPESISDYEVEKRVPPESIGIANQRLRIENQPSKIPNPRRADVRATMKWKTYRTRFLVKAKQLDSNLSFIDPLGRHHSGRKGDYLVESSDGAFSITPRRIFEDVYVAMPMEHRGAFVDLPEDQFAARLPNPTGNTHRPNWSPTHVAGTVSPTAGGFLGDRSADVTDFD